MKKIVLAIHGIGDQTRNETILATGARFRGIFEEHTPLSLGEFHRALEDGRPPFPLCRMGFAEIYWADIPRRVVAAGYTLQETKAWARSVVERVQAVGRQRLAKVDYGLVKDVLEEMITTIAVLEALLFLAKKAGILDFNLKQLLDDYIGDVQLVVEFADLRQQVLRRFETMLENASDSYPEAEIYLVAHSEGTVVALLCLLAAASSKAPPHWLKQIRGFMTLGSPISKHLVLWPKLFAGFTGAQPAAARLGIPWMNYYDYGDPVGFDLQIARDWLRERNYDGVFAFPEANDFGFGRYYFPGKAHVDYWNDGRIFGHFIVNVVDPVPPVPEARSWRAPPPDIRAAQVLCYIVPYAAFVAVVGAAVYLLYRGIGLTLDLHGAPASRIPENVTALSALLAGATASLRIRRLTKSFPWLAVAGLILAAGIGIYARLAQNSPELRWLAAVPGWVGIADPRAGVLALGAGTMILAVGIAVVDRIYQSLNDRRRRFRFSGAQIVAGSIALALTAVANLFPGPQRMAIDRLWPALLYGALFVYLWWLSGLLFDLVFVWHRYIRTSLAVRVLRKPPETASNPQKKYDPL